MSAERFDAASVAIFRDGEVLLIKRATEPFMGFWTLPGGRLLPGEDPEECARREVAEELRVNLGTLRFVAAHRTGAFTLAVFVTGQFTKKPEPSEEVADLGFYGFDKLAGLQTTPGLADVLESAQSVLTGR